MEKRAQLSQRKAVAADLAGIIELLHDDELGQHREDAGAEIHQRYAEVFSQIAADPSHYLMVVERCGELVGTCHLTLIPSLTFLGSLRLQIEAVRVSTNVRGQGIGSWMIRQAIDYGATRGARIIQLTTNKQRVKALRFYESLGFQATHEGMKLYL